MSVEGPFGGLLDACIEREDDVAPELRIAGLEQFAAVSDGIDAKKGTAAPSGEFGIEGFFDAFASGQIRQIEIEIGASAKRTASSASAERGCGGVFSFGFPLPTYPMMWHARSPKG